jgi:hypothetical protein
LLSTIPVAFRSRDFFTHLSVSNPVVVQTDTVARTERVPDDVSVSLNAWLFLISLTGSVALLAYLLFRWSEVGRICRNAQQPDAKWIKMLREAALSAGLNASIHLKLTNRATITIKDKVPILGDLPLIKPMFRHQSTQTYPQLLFLVVTPEIVSGTNSVSQ